MKRLLVYAFPLTFLVGCAGGPVGWGGTHEVLQANDKFVTYRYDPLVGGRSSAANAAAAHCGGYGKIAEPTMRGNEGIIQIQTYECRSPQGNATAAQAQSNQLSSKMKFGFENSGICYKQLEASEIGEPVTKSILVMSDGQSNKYDLLSSKAKLNDSQKKALKSFLASASNCRKILSDAASGTPYAAPLAKRDAETDLIYTKLLTGQMTVGEANLARDQLRAKSRDEIMALGKSLDAQFNNSHNSEVAQDDENRRRLAEAYRANQQAQQQQQIINQNQQLINNQIQQNMKPPAPRTPVQTDCYRIGNSVSCTTQ
jgi:hypothetical protein